MYAIEMIFVTLLILAGVFFVVSDLMRLIPFWRRVPLDRSASAEQESGKKAA